MNKSNQMKNSSENDNLECITGCQDEMNEKNHRVLWLSRTAAHSLREIGRRVAEWLCEGSCASKHAWSGEETF